MNAGVAAAVLILAASSWAFATDSATSSSTACAPGYSPCLPVRGDLDCDQIADARKPVRVTGADPYGLDRDRDGLGCEVAGEGGGGRSPWGLILRKPPRKEATSVKVGDTLTVVGWSPASAKGQAYFLCVKLSGGGRKCRGLGQSSYVLRGVVQRLGTWKVARGEGRRGVFKMALLEMGRTRASDTVPLR